MDNLTLAQRPEGDPMPERPTWITKPRWRRTRVFLPAAALMSGALFTVGWIGLWSWIFWTLV